MSIISDALYSDSDLVVEAMAELFDDCIRDNQEGKVSKDRMSQARYIMEVDEDAFRSITAEDLYRIELKEMEDVLGELVSAVGLQRFRFSERQANGTITTLGGDVSYFFISDTCLRRPRGMPKPD